MLGIAPHLFSFVRVFAALPDFGLGSQSSPSRPAALWRSAVVRQLVNCHQSVEGAQPGLNNFFCFLLALFFSVYTVHPATVTSGLRVEFVSDFCTYQVIGRYRWASRGGLTKRRSDQRKSNPTSKGASSEKTQ